MNQEEIKEILNLHQKWLKGEDGGKRADFRHADLSGADLRFANLTDANLCKACLRGANLYNAYLYGADLYDTNLQGARLESANLCRAYLHGANLCHADLKYADLRDAYLSGATLRHADLKGASLRYTNLSDTDLRNADLSGAILDEACLNGAFLDTKDACRKGIIVKRSIIGWKKCKDDVIVKLEIPTGAVVFCINGDKCRTNIAKVVEVIGAEKGISTYDNEFVYRKGRTYKIKNFNLAYNVRCAEGIHFFRTREEAEAWQPC